MSFSQIAVVGKDCYQLLTDGTIKQFVREPTLESWKVIDQNPDNVQIAASTPVALRRKNGDLYRFVRTWNHLATNAHLMWGWNGRFWLWQNTSGNLWYEGPETNDKWELRDTNPLTQNLVSVSGSVYQLAGDGKITHYQSPGNWNLVDSDPAAASIATDNKSLFKMQKNGLIYRLESGKWERIGADLRTVEIAAGDAGLFQRQKDGRVYKYTGQASWQMSDPHTDNTHIAVASSAYRVNSKGEIYILDDKGVWQLLKDTVITKPKPKEKPVGVQPAEVYDGGHPEASETLLRIGNGAAGQSGLIHVLADEFIKYRVSKGFPAFKVAWYKSDTTESIKYLKEGTVDLAITYTAPAEAIALKQGIAQSTHYLFREHLLIVGPPSNPAKLDPKSDILDMIADLYTAAESETPTTPPVRFLSRYDKSATNIKDSELWIGIGQVPWASKYSTWYHQYVAYPTQALAAAAALQEYTLTDWGTYLTVDKSVQQQVVIYKRGTDDVKDLLLMPGHLLVGSKAKDPALAKEFAAWATGKDGQALIKAFLKNGQLVYSPAP
ncbi:hypothetical protein BJX99DRAFT_230316 [Aspergillus californicus]